jgi:hypothetical protein
MDNQDCLKRFDQVKILTTKNVKYLSAPPGTKTTPLGMWSVVAAVGQDVLLAQKSTIILIPATDVLKVLSYGLESVIKNLGRLSDGEG